MFCLAFTRTPAVRMAATAVPLLLMRTPRPRDEETCLHRLQCPELEPEPEPEPELALGATSAALIAIPRT